MAGLLKYWSELEDSRDFQNCLFYRECPLLKGGGSIICLITVLPCCCEIWFALSIFLQNGLETKLTCCRHVCTMHVASFPIHCPVIFAWFVWVSLGMSYEVHVYNNDMITYVGFNFSWRTECIHYVAELIVLLHSWLYQTLVMHVCIASPLDLLMTTSA